jgi:hypothetical protein
MHGSLLVRGGRTPKYARFAPRFQRRQATFREPEYSTKSQRFPYKSSKTATVP